MAIGQSLDDLLAKEHDRPLADSPIITTDLEDTHLNSREESDRKYKLNSNLVRSIDSNGDRQLAANVDELAISSSGGYTSNSMGYRIDKVRHNGHQNKVRDNRTKKRMNRNNSSINSSPNCGYGSLQKRIKCIQKENRQWILTNEISGSGGNFARTNRDLVRSLDTQTESDSSASNSKGNRKVKGGKRRHRRRNRRRYRIAGLENLPKEERRKRRKAEKRRIRQLEKKRKKMKKRAMRKRLKELQKERRRQQAASDTKLGRSRRTADTAVGSSGQCSMKHVDTCSWPQCNRSCPKLHNPLTGQFYLFLYF
jgi:hypothetical protein